MSSNAEPISSLQSAFNQAAKLLQSSPQLAAKQAEEILTIAPGHPTAQLLLGTACRLLGQNERALGLLQAVTRGEPTWAFGRYELGLVLSRLGRRESALLELRKAVELMPDLPDAWRALADEYTAACDIDNADAAYAQHIRTSNKDPRLMAAAAALCANDIPLAEAHLRTHLKDFPTDVAAIRMFAEVAARLRRYKDAENLLARCLQLAPGFAGARYNYAMVLHRLHKPIEALREVDVLLAAEPQHPGYNNLKAAVFAQIGAMEQSIELYEGVLRTQPQQPKVWLSYGHALKTAGREADSIRAYEQSLSLQPGLGEAYWSLANLKTLRFTAEQVQAMRAQLARRDLADEDRFHLYFALGKALEDAGDYAGSFEHYRQGNELRRQEVRYSAADMTAHVRRCRGLFTEQFFSARAGFGSPAADPIFIVGLPRAGSTLIEQILSSHSQVEGTMELPDIVGIARSLVQPAAESPTPYLEVLKTLSAQQCQELGEQYLRQTRIQRRSTAPFFIDKMPNNFAHVGLIQLLLPNARIIDARRHPLGCCFSGFKQHFARGQHFTYSLSDLGQYYRDYVELMAHMDGALPGRIHRVFYEQMILDTENQVRQLLDYCGLPFEQQCLRFYETERAVRTASSQQVRQPIFRSGLEQYQHFEPWLGELHDSLGDVLTMYPQVPPLS